MWFGEVTVSKPLIFSVFHIFTAVMVMVKLIFLLEAVTITMSWLYTTHLLKLNANTPD